LHRDVRAFAREIEGRGAPDPPAPSGHERDPTVQPTHMDRTRDTRNKVRGSVDSAKGKNPSRSYGSRDACPPVELGTFPEGAPKRHYTARPMRRARG